MKKIEIKDCMHHLEMLGRTYETENGLLYFNWTCSGIRFDFEGSILSIRLKAQPSAERDMDPSTGQFHDRLSHPWIAVFLDDLENPYQYFELQKENHIYLLFQSETVEKHTITIRKMTENQKGRVGIVEFLTDGIISASKKCEKKLKLEFIGDSITCGYGNMINDGNSLYYSKDQNGWMSYAAIAARKLGADFSLVSYSGITATEGLNSSKYEIPPMEYFYPYCDRLQDKIEGFAETPRQWDFNSFQPDIIILNLGTNDATVIELNEDIQAGIAKFEINYYRLLKMIREYNGKNPWIICSLGSMDYFLFDNIKKVVEKYSNENQDNRISCFKFSKIRFTDGLGACRHPYVTTQIRMGEELVEYIRNLPY